MPGLIAHEWIGRSGGSERVLDSLSRLYPDADIFCLWNDDPHRYSNRVTESFLARSPLRGHKALALPVMPLVWSAFDDSGYDWVLSSSHAFAHQISERSSLPVEKHFTYVHTPARYLWTPELDGRGASATARALAAPLRRLDRGRGRRHANVAANSAFVRDRIAAAWGIDAAVIHPPVEVEALQRVDGWAHLVTGAEADVLDVLPSPFLLGASRFIPYKRLELVIAAGEAAGLPVVLAGSGPELGALATRAAEAVVPVTIIESPSDAMLRALMERAAVYIFPAVEDFGIMPVEAMALGTPVVIAPVGGAAESVVDGVTGSILPDESAESLRVAVTRCLELSPEDSRARARQFDSTVFDLKIESWMANA